MTGAAPSGVVTFLFTVLRGRPVGGRTTRMACGSLSPLMMTYCAARLRSAGASCSSTPATGCARPSPRRGPPSMPRWLPSGCWSCRCGWGWRPARPSYAKGGSFGAVLNRAARVMAAGHGGQILVADSTAVLLSGVDLLDLGPRRLRDVSAPVGVFQVRAPGLRTEFPSLQALDTSPGNLRPAASSFIGRESEARLLRRCGPGA
jgi:hypothetical protein